MSPTRHPALALSFLGPPSLRVGRRTLDPAKLRKCFELAAILCLHHGRSLERRVIEGVLWPDKPEKRAQGSLRQALHLLGLQLGAAKRRVRRPPGALAMDLDGASADVCEFDHAVQRGDEASLRRAIQLYRGPLLEGWNSEWIAEYRDERAEAYLGALDRLAALLVARGAGQEAVPYLQRRLRADPLCEEACCALMELHAAAGRSTEAIRVYAALRRAVNEGNDGPPVDPGAEARALYSRIRSEARRTPATATQRGRHAPQRPHPARGVEIHGTATVGDLQLPVRGKIELSDGLLSMAGMRLELTVVSGCEVEENGHDDGTTPAGR
jgi:DNA-binding SARP family transcriptional activator